MKFRHMQLSWDLLVVICMLEHVHRDQGYATPDRPVVVLVDKDVQEAPGIKLVEHEDAQPLSFADIAVALKSAFHASTVPNSFSMAA